MENIPKLRFPQYKDSWTKTKLKEFVVEMRGGASLTPADILTKGDYKIIPKKAIQAGGLIVLDDNCNYVTKDVFEKFEKNQIDLTYILVVLRDLVPSGPSIGYVVKNDKVEKGILAQGVYGIKLNKNLQDSFLIQYSNTPQYRTLMKTIMVGSTQVHIRNTTYLDIDILHPSIEEQQKIADFLSEVDNIITASEQEIESLKMQKKGAMQKIFSQEVRFKADDGSEYPEWGNKALSAIGHFYGGLSGKTKEDFGKGTGKYITYMNVYKNVFIDNNTLELVEIKDNEKQNKVEYGDLLFTQSSETIEEVGLTSVYLFNDKPFLNSFCMGFRLDNIEATFPKYLGYLMRTDFIRKQIMREGQGISRINLSGNRILNITIKIPKSLEEQQKIADFLSEFDNAIEYAKEELEVWKNIKKGLLQQMFE